MIRENLIPLPTRGHIKKNQKNNPPTLDEILLDVCQSFNEPIDDVLGKKRKEDLVKCRRIYFYVANVLTNESCDAIAGKINKDHTTYLFHIENCECWFRIGEPKFMSQWETYLSNTGVWYRYFNQINTIQA